MTALMKKICHLFAFSFYYLSFSFHSKIFLPIQNTIWTHSTLYILTTTDCYHFYHSEKLKAMALIYIYVRGKMLWKRVILTVIYILRKRNGNDNDRFRKIFRSAIGVNPFLHNVPKWSATL